MPTSGGASGAVRHWGGPSTAMVCAESSRGQVGSSRGCVGRMGGGAACTRLHFGVHLKGQNRRGWCRERLASTCRLKLYRPRGFAAVALG